MAAEASEPEMSGIDVAKKRKVWRSIAEPWPSSGMHASRIRAPTPPVRSIDRYHAKHSLCLVVCRSTRPRGGHLPGRPAPSLGWKSAYSDYPRVKVGKPEELRTRSNVRGTAAVVHGGPVWGGPATAGTAGHPPRRPSKCPTVSVRWCARGRCARRPSLSRFAPA
jgi:hypothetical protein